jgi:hypothetical protein
MPDQIIAQLLPVPESNPYWIAAIAVLYMLTGATTLALLLRLAVWACWACVRRLTRPVPNWPDEVDACDHVDLSYRRAQLDAAVGRKRQADNVLRFSRWQGVR